MVPLNEIFIFAAAALLLAITPGPNLIYLTSRALCQGRQAGIVSLMGVLFGFFVHVCAASIGLSALFLAVPAAYELLKWIGSAYLVWLAWQSVKPGARSPFETQELPYDSPRKLFLMGFLTSALNPKIAVFYVSIFPQFISPEYGSILTQSLMLGLTQIIISFSINLLVVLSASHIASWFTRNPTWLAIQRYFMGFVLMALAIRLAFEQRRTP